MKGQGEDRTAAWLKNNLQTAERQAVVRLRLAPKRAAAGNKSPDFIIEMEVRLAIAQKSPCQPILLEFRKLRIFLQTLNLSAFASSG